MEAISARFLEDLRAALEDHEVRYLFIGKAAAIIQGFVDTTQDADLFVEKSRENAERLIEALKEAGAELSERDEEALRAGKDFIQLGGEISVDVVHAPDGIESFDQAWQRGRDVDGFAVCSLDDVIESKRKANRQKDRESLPRLQNFRQYLKQQGRIPGRSLPIRGVPKRSRTRETSQDEPPVGGQGLPVGR